MDKDRYPRKMSAMELQIAIFFLPKLFDQDG